MFQPRATPQFVSFPANYGLRDELADYSGFQQLPAQLSMHGPPPVGVGGDLFSPTAFGGAVHAHSPSYNPNANMASPTDLKPEPGAPDDLAAQEAAARDYEPHLEVRFLPPAPAPLPPDPELTAFRGHQGEPVGEKLPSHVITDEYVKADPTYVAKTMVGPEPCPPGDRRPTLTVHQALPQKYSHYRPIQGDGNCGWRGE